MAMDSGKGQTQEPEGEGGNSPHRPRQAKHLPRLAGAATQRGPLETLLRAASRSQP